MKLFKLLPTIAATVLAASISVVANAALITGTINFSGGGTFTTTNGTTVDSIAVTGLEASRYAEISGDFATYINGGDLATLATNPWVVSNPNPSPEIALWQIGGFTFTMSNVVLNSITGGSADVRTIGYLSRDGFENTLGTFDISSQSGLVNIAFSATGASVPEPSAAALLALGVAGLALGRRRSARK